MWRGRQQNSDWLVERWKEMEKEALTPCQGLASQSTSLEASLVDN